MHESTVSRAISSKYVHTPHGVFPLRHFFQPSSRTETGAGRCQPRHLDRERSGQPEGGRRPVPREGRSRAMNARRREHVFVAQFQAAHVPRAAFEASQ